MSEGISDFKRVLSSSGLYAAAALTQRGLAFVLLPIYTRFLDPAEYGKLELLTAFSSIAFGLLVIGLPSAIMKCYHRDCETAADRARVLATACVIAVPLLIVGTFACFAAAPRIAILVVGSESASGLVRIVITTGLLTSCSGLILASLRTQERAFAFSALVVPEFFSGRRLQRDPRCVLWLGPSWGAVGQPICQCPSAARRRACRPQIV